MRYGCEWTKVARDEVKRALQNEVGVQRLLNCDVEYLNYVWCGSMNVRQRSEIPINLVPGGGGVHSEVWDENDGDSGIYDVSDMIVTRKVT